MKKLFSFILSVIMVAFVLGSTMVSFATSENIGDSNTNFNMTFNIETKTLTVNGLGATYGTGNKTYVEFENSDKYSVDDIRKVEVLEGITVIDAYTFAYLTSLEEVTLPKSLVRINAHAFKNCKKLGKINYAGEKEDWQNVVINKTDNSSLLSSKVKYDVDVEDSEDIDDSLVKIENDYGVYDFETAMVSIKAKGVLDTERIASEGFYLGDEKEHQMICVEGAEFSEGVTVLGEDVMAGCYDLEYVNIPKSVTTIKKDCFSDCHSLKTIYFAGSKDDWSKVIVEEEGNEDFLDAKVVYGETDDVNNTPMFICMGAVILASVCLTVVATKKARKK